MFLLTPLLFFAIVALFALCWNRLFDPVGRRAVVLLVALVSLYEAQTLFMPAVDVPADLAFHAYPWKALGQEAVKANSGIVFTQMIPWTETARRALFSGELPLWNRFLGSGSPLLADLQTSIAHPFTVAGLVLPIGEAWTLSVCLRLFFSLFFLFVFLRRWSLHPIAALFGAIAYTFATFHIISLLFPLGLSMMMLPAALVGVDEVMLRPRRRSFALLTVALVCAIFGGHPESSVWVGLTAGAYALYLFFATGEPAGRGEPGEPARAARRYSGIVLAGTAALCSALLTMFFWYPTIRILPHTDRYNTLLEANPTNHHIGADWMLPLVTPNILGTPQWGDYRAPEPQDPAVPNDYGEVACGYAGAITLALALTAAIGVRRRPFAFFAGAMLVSFLTIYETPGWYHLIRSIPWVGMALHQRWRFLWALGASVNAAIALDALLTRTDVLRIVRRGTVLVLGLIGAIYFFKSKELIERHVMSHQLLWFALAVVALGGFLALLRRAERGAIALSSVGAAAVVVTFLELVAVMFRYNPPVSPKRFYPATGAIQAMQNAPRPYRIAAAGWSFLPDTPGYYRLEDIKTTDVVQYREYSRLLHGFLRMHPGDFNQTIGDFTSPFLDYLGVRFIYVPADVAFSPEQSMQRVYSGPDGVVYRNHEAFPRYWLAPRFRVTPSIDEAIAEMKATAFRNGAAVDHVPAKIARLSAGALSADLAGGGVRLLRYTNNESVLRVVSRGWNLLVTSDVSMPGWRVYWNGDRLPPVIVNGAFLGTFIPPGEGEVRLRYLPTEFVDGLRAGAVTLAAIVLAFGAVTIARRRRHLHA